MHKDRMLLRVEHEIQHKHFEGVYQQCQIGKIE